ncbi:hypothetical protein D9M71_193090 [compost metagenome]
MALFVIEKQVAIKQVNERSPTECTSDLRQGIERHFALVEIGEQAQGDTHGRVQVCAGNTGGEVDGHAHADTPDDADFPQAKAGARYFEGSDATRTKEYQQGGAEEFGHALAG